MGKTVAMEEAVDIGFSECAIAWVVGRVHITSPHFIVVDSFFLLPGM